MAQRNCTVDGCGRTEAARGLCSRHYYRQQRGLPLDATYAELRATAKPACSVDGCGQPSVARGMCRPHYSRQWQRRYRAEQPEKVRAWGYKKYGLTADDVANLLAAQGGVCPICELPPERAHIDHNHDTGQVRGILCHNCNIGLGHFRDDMERLIRATSYLVSGRPW